MAAHVEGPLHVERLGPEGTPMVFLHPNPMDGSCWLYQMAHFSTWYRTVAVDLPGYGRSPRATAGLTMDDIAEACWEAVDGVTSDPAILVGLSVGAWIAPYMGRQQPDRVVAMVLSGVGLSPDKEFARRRIASYDEQGVEFRREHAAAVLSRSFGETPMAAYLTEMFLERNVRADGPTIVEMFRALERPDPDWLWSGIHVPTLIVTGTEDNAHPRALALPDHIPDCELVKIEGAGHSCNLEQPWAFDAAMIDFLGRRGLHPGTTG
jgi:pimeloyl-ACP methyl ester carboxylesterase